MSDNEEFSLCCWATDNAVKWNRRTGRGILYRGYGRIADSESIPFITKQTSKPFEMSTWGT